MSHDTPTAAEKLLDQILDGKITDPQEIEAIRQQIEVNSQQQAPIAPPPENNL